MIIPIIYGIILSLGHYFSEEISGQIKGFKDNLISFAAGISITYVFLVLLPELYRGVQDLDKLIFIFVLMGFASLHLVDKQIYKYAPKRDLKRELKEVHSAAFFLYHIIVGMLIVSFIRTSIFNGTLFLVPVFFQTVMSGISFGELHQQIKESLTVRIILSSSSTIGVVIALVVFIPSSLNSALTGLLAGILMYIVIREFIPRDKAGEPKYFFYGMMFYVLLIITMWILNG